MSRLPFNFTSYPFLPSLPLKFKPLLLKFVYFNSIRNW